MGNLPPGRKHLFFHRDPGTWHLHPGLSARWSVNEIEDDPPLECPRKLGSMVVNGLKLTYL